MTVAALTLVGLAAASYLLLVRFHEPQGFAGGVIASLLVAMGQIGIVVLVVDALSRRDQEARDRKQAEIRLNASIHGALAIVANAYGVRRPIYSPADQILSAIHLSKRRQLTSLTGQLEDVLGAAFTSKNGTLAFPWEARDALEDLAEACGVLDEDVVATAHHLAGAWGADQAWIVVNGTDYLPRDIASLMTLISRLERR
ncbi:hypothetical protein [Blastococcus atacamensis]|uniref:hypothetical protein n=1 Tax=Blastococcus atacamensis TaxID=2070508 RepID=UPI000CEC6FBD|nr:hypothetical protein [Blastococcus atacamensis]